MKGNNSTYLIGALERLNVIIYANCLGTMPAIYRKFLIKGENLLWIGISNLLSLMVSVVHSTTHFV